MAGDFPDRRSEVLITVSESLPEGLADDIVQDLAAGGTDAAAVRVPGGPFAGLELYLPSAIAIFIASSYFGGVFQKMGEDHYVALKKAASNLFGRTSDIRITLVGTKGKVSRRQTYSLTFSITAELKQGLRAKLLFPVEGSREDAEKSISTFFELVGAINNGAVVEAEFEALLTFPPVGKTILVTLDRNTHKIVSVDPFADRRANL